MNALSKIPSSDSDLHVTWQNQAARLEKDSKHLAEAGYRSEADAAALRQADFLSLIASTPPRTAKGAQVQIDMAVGFIEDENGDPRGAIALRNASAFLGTIFGINPPPINGMDTSDLVSLYEVLLHLCDTMIAFGCQPRFEQDGHMSPAGRYLEDCSDCLYRVVGDIVAEIKSRNLQPQSWIVADWDRLCGV